MVQSPEIVPAANPRVTVTITRNMTTRGMRRAILEAMEGAPHDLVLDMRALAVMHDTGVALLIGVNARVRARRRLLTLVCAKGSPTEQALTRAGLTRVFTLVPALGLLPPA